MRCNAENGSLLFFLSFLKGGNCSFLDVTYAKSIFILILRSLLAIERSCETLKVFPMIASCRCSR